MKKVLILAVVVLSAAILIYACGSSSSNKTTTPAGPGVAKFTTPAQAASSAASLGGAVSLSSTIGNVSGMAGSAIPSGYAPGKKGKVVNTAPIANLDPRLKVMVDKMMAELRSPMVTGAMSKGRSFKALNTVRSAATTTTINENCTLSGSMSLTATDNSAAGYSDFVLDITYTNCKDTVSEEMTGAMHARHKLMKDNSSEISDMTLSSLTLKQYQGSTVYETIVLNGTFNSTDNKTSGNEYADGTFAMDSQGQSSTFAFSKLNDAWTKSGTSLPITEEHTSTGSFSLSFPIPANSGLQGNPTTMSFVIALTNLDVKDRSNVDGSTDEWLNGGISMTWTPAIPGSECVPGSLTVSTDVANPIHTPSTGCPTSGKATVNGATVEFGVPSGSQVTVTLNGTSQTFTDCNSMDTGGCGLM